MTVGRFLNLVNVRFFLPYGVDISTIIEFYDLFVVKETCISFNSNNSDASRRVVGNVEVSGVRSKVARVVAVSKHPVYQSHSAACHANPVGIYNGFVALVFAHAIHERVVGSDDKIAWIGNFGTVLSFGFAGFLIKRERINSVRALVGVSSDKHRNRIALSAACEEHSEKDC